MRFDPHKLIDALLAEAGWKLTEDRDREFEVAGMPSDSGVGYVDYVLWGDDGLPLALVEAKKSMVSPQVGQQQAKLYADCLEAEFGQRPVIFYSNGHEHWLWDDTRYPPRAVQGFLAGDELDLMIQRRTTRQPLESLDIDDSIVERHYQQRAIRAIAEHFETDKQRKALLVMATGAGKTRTVIALVDLLMRANLVKRVLFLADRTALVNQAVGAFKAHLPDSAPVNLVTEGHADGRVYVSTYQTMVGKIDECRPDGTRRFGVGHFDLVVIDEAHRSVFRKYRGIFEYFDSFLVGLTATPRDEVDKNTYDLFDLETGVPTDAYALDDAIADNFLVRPHLELVERLREANAWETVSVGDLAALTDRVAKLPDQLDPDQEESKRFDVLLLDTQLSALRGEPFERQRRKVMQIAGALEDQQAIPAIAEQLGLIQRMQADEWWVDVSYPMLEEVRKRPRLLVPLIERSSKSVIYSDFTDDIGEGAEVELPGTGGAVGSTEFLQFRRKAEHILGQHLAEAAVAKVRSGEPLTAVDIAELQRILVAAGIGDEATFAEASEQAGSFGLFIRSLVGLDRAAAKAAFAEFLDGRRYSRNQIEFVNLIIDELTDRGVVEARRVYESPYIGLAPEGPEEIFVEADLDRIFAAIHDLRTAAARGAG